MPDPLRFSISGCTFSNVRVSGGGHYNTAPRLPLQLRQPGGGSGVLPAVPGGLATGPGYGAVVVTAVRSADDAWSQVWQCAGWGERAETCGTDIWM